MKRHLLNLMLSLSAVEVSPRWFEPLSGYKDCREFLKDLEEREKRPKLSLSELLKANSYETFKEQTSVFVSDMYNGNFDLILKFFSEHSSVDVNNSIENCRGTLLHFAVYYKIFPLVNRLLYLGANPNQFDIKGRKAFDYLFESMEEEYKNDDRSRGSDHLNSQIARALLNAGAIRDFSTFDLEQALKAGYLETARVISENNDLLGHSYPPVYIYPLHNAAKYNKKDVVDDLIPSGADLGEKDFRYGYTPARHAFANKNYALGVYLGAANLAQKYLKEKQEQDYPTRVSGLID